MTLHLSPLSKLRLFLSLEDPPTPSFSLLQPPKLPKVKPLRLWLPFHLLLTCFWHHPLPLTTFSHYMVSPYWMSSFHQKKPIIDSYTPPSKSLHTRTHPFGPSSHRFTSFSISQVIPFCIFHNLCTISFNKSLYPTLLFPFSHTHTLRKKSISTLSQFHKQRAILLHSFLSFLTIHTSN